jgi:hypothetical protein
MTHDHNIFIFDYPFDRNLLLSEMNRFEDEFKPYTDNTGTYITDWTIARHINFDYADELCNVFDVQGKPRFYKQKAGYTLGMHRDRGTECSINVLLDYNNPAPVDFEDASYSYTQCLLNTQNLHGVTANNEDRVLFKISIFNEDYASVVRKIQKVIDKC